MTESTASAASTLFWGHPADFWDTCLIWSVILAFVVAGFVGVSTVGSIRANKLEADKAAAELEKYKVGADERAKAAELEIEKQKTEIAQANARAAEANLALEKFKAPRTLSDAAAAKIEKAAKAFPGTPFAVSTQTDPETIGLMERVVSVLKSAGWKMADWSPSSGVTWNHEGWEQIGINSLVGVYVQMDASKFKEHGDAANAVAGALADAGIPVKGEAGILPPGMDKENVIFQFGQKPH